MPYVVRVPKLGLEIENATSEWFLEEGEAVAPGDPMGLVTESEGKITDPVATARETEAVTDGGRTPPREATARSEDGMTGTVRTGGIEQDYGDGSDPSPVDLFLGSLAACLSLSIRYQADMRDVPLGDIEVETDAEPESGSVESIEITVRLDAPETDESTLDRIVEYGERSCHVAELLREDLPVEIDWRRSAG